MPTLSHMDEHVAVNDGAEEEQIDNGLVAFFKMRSRLKFNVALTLE